MVLLIWFVVIDDSQYDEGDTDTGVDRNGRSSVHDDSGKPFVIVLSYKIAYHVQEITAVLVKKIVGDLYIMIFVNHFWCC